MRFSAAVRVALAPDSLTIIPPRTSFVNTFFSFFLQILTFFFVGLYNVVFSFPRVFPARRGENVFFPYYMGHGRMFRKGFTCGLAAEGLY